MGDLIGPELRGRVRQVGVQLRAAALDAELACDAAEVVDRADRDGGRSELCGDDTCSSRVRMLIDSLSGCMKPKAKLMQPPLENAA